MSLRAQVLQAGASLGVREAAGITIRLAGVLAITRLLGPEQFGIYAGAAAIVTFLAMIAQFSMEVHLIRAETDPSPEVYSRVFSFLAVSSAVIALGALAASFVLDDLFRNEAYVQAFRVLLISIPLNVLWVPALARIERALRYRALAFIEVGGDIVLYGVAIPLAALGFGVWAPVTGYLSWQVWLLVSSFAASPQLPRLTLSLGTGRSLLEQGFRISTFTWLAQSVSLVNPLVVGFLMGPAAVGYVALASRLADTLTFVTRATYRLSIVAFGRVQGDLGRVRRGLEEGMALQVLACGPLLAAFALVAPLVVPAVFGSQWQPVLVVFPFLAVFYMGDAAFALHGSVLMVSGLYGPAVRATLARLVILIGLSVALVPALGTLGYGIAAAASLGGYVLSDVGIRRLFPVDYADVALWGVAFTPALFAPVIPAAWRAVLLAPIVVVFATPRARSRIREYLAAGRRATGRDAREVRPLP
jgi:O-antigen/teichoic acid export membrane protein